MKMDTQQQEQLRDRMGEASALDASDPRRAALMAQVAEAGPWAEREWLALVGESERLRLELARGGASASLRQRLLALPDEAAVRRAGWSPAARWSGAAAAVAAMAACVALIVLLPSGAAAEQRFGTLGLLAAEHYDHEPAIVTGDAGRIETAVADRLHFEVSVPRLGDGYELLGATVCTLGGHRVLCTRWLRDGRAYRLYQFCQSDYDLPERFDRRVIRAAGPWEGGADQAVEFWSDSGCAYAMVAPPEHGHD